MTSRVAINGIGGQPCLVGTSAERVAYSTTNLPFLTRWVEDTGDEYYWNGTAWKKLNTDSAEHASIQSDYRGGYPETVQQTYPYTGTAAALGDVVGLDAFGFPFKTIRITKSAAVDNATVRCSLSGRGKMIIVISGLATETIALTALVDGVNASNALCVRQMAGTYAAASALGNGTYYLVVE